MLGPTLLVATSAFAAGMAIHVARVGWALPRKPTSQRRLIERISWGTCSHLRRYVT